MLDKELEQTLNDAFRQAREQRHEFMTVEHLLLALLDNQSAILRYLQMRMKGKLNRHLDSSVSCNARYFMFSHLGEKKSLEQMYW
jgi:ATP-dependent Clp protease ATP-binding subunit ClpA